MKPHVINFYITDRCNYIQDKENTVWEATLNIVTSANGEKVLYEIHPIKMVEQSGKPNTSTTNNKISQNEPIVKGELKENSEHPSGRIKKQLRNTDATRGVYINDSTQAFTEQILNGEKTIETREQLKNRLFLLRICDKSTCPVNPT